MSDGTCKRGHDRKALDSVLICLACEAEDEARTNAVVGAMALKLAAARRALEGIVQVEVDAMNCVECTAGDRATASMYAERARVGLQESAP